MIFTVTFLFFLFLNYAAYLFVTRKSDARRVHLERRVTEALRDSDESQETYVNLSRENSISSIPLFDRLLSPLRFTKKLDLMVSQADIQITVGRLLMFCILAGVMATLAAYTIFSSLLIVFFLGLVAALLPVVHISWTRQRRFHKFMEYLPDTLDLMSRSLGVGHAFSEALHQVSTEMPEPISTEFRITYEEQKLGLSLKTALERLSKRIPLLDLRLCITAVLIQRETGGNLAEILEKVSQTMRERFKLMEDFKTMTTSSRGSAWVLCGLPFGIVLLLTALNPDYMSVLLHDPRGHYIIGVAAAMQIMGMLLIFKILAIKI